MSHPTTPPHSPSSTLTPPYPTTTIRQPISPASTVAAASPVLARCVRQVIQHIRHLHQDPQCFALSPTDWTILQNAVFASPLGKWARDKLRWDYAAHTRQVTLRMASPLQEKFVHELQRLIAAKTDALRDGAEGGSRARTLLDAISGGGSPCLRLSTSNDDDDACTTTRSPDISFQFAGASRPPFVAEVAVSQNGAAEFPAIAEQYLSTRAA